MHPLGANKVIAFVHLLFCDSVISEIIQKKLLILFTAHFHKIKH